MVFYPDGLVRTWPLRYSGDKKAEGFRARVAKLKVCADGNGQAYPYSNLYGFAPASLFTPNFSTPLYEIPNFVHSLMPHRLRNAFR